MPPPEVLLFTLLLLLLCGPEAQALTPSLWSEAAISVYGLGAKVTVNPGLEQALWNKEGDLLFDDTWLGLSLRLEGTPAFARAGPELRFSPAAVLEVNAHALGTSYFGNFTALVGFDHPQADYGPEAQQVAISEGRRSGGRATDVGFYVTVNGKAGPIVLTATGAWSRWTFLPPAENLHDWYYEPEYNVMMASEGETVVSPGRRPALRGLHGPRQGRRDLRGQLQHLPHQPGGPGPHRPHRAGLCVAARQPLDLVPAHPGHPVGPGQQGPAALHGHPRGVGALTRRGVSAEGAEPGALSGAASSDRPS